MVCNELKIVIISNEDDYGLRLIEHKTHRYTILNLYIMENAYLTLDTITDYWKNFYFHWEEPGEN